jgi:hypothetical protein
VKKVVSIWHRNMAIGFCEAAVIPIDRVFSVIAETDNLGYLESMNETVIPASTPRTADKLALAQAAFREFHARCFWFMRPDAEIVAEEVPYICERLRADGGRRGFHLAADLCR